MDLVLQTFERCAVCALLGVTVAQLCVYAFLKGKHKLAKELDKCIVLKPLVIPSSANWTWSDYNSRAVFVSTAEGEICVFSHRGKEIAEIVIPEPFLRFEVSENELTTDFYGSKTTHKLSEMYNSIEGNNRKLPEPQHGTISIKRHSLWVYIRSSSGDHLLQMRGIMFVSFPILACAISLICVTIIKLLL